MTRSMRAVLTSLALFLSLLAPQVTSAAPRPRTSRSAARVAAARKPRPTRKTSAAPKKAKKKGPWSGDAANLVPDRPLENAASYLPPAGEVRSLDPALVHFTQWSMSAVFRDGKTVADLIRGLDAGTVRAEDVPPIRVFERNGALWSLDNRRLYVWRALGLPVRVVAATAQEIDHDSFKYSTPNGGTSIEVRGDARAVAAAQAVVAEIEARRTVAAAERARESGASESPDGALLEAIRARDRAVEGARAGSPASGLEDVLRDRFGSEAAGDRGGK